ncbi:hypothetical protein CVT91_02780 [Candidatus Atribacteria bacterium HGW-Atribacteria-1]|nr:MAG: hypothetical protein CVT91_02780 [Candidatus Atribacteria bacterium HGW-Atribacteria-1]
MGVYTEILSDSEIVGMCEGFDTIVILGCGACANEAFAYLKYNLISKTIQNEEEHTYKQPYAINCEMERIKDILRNKGHRVKTMIINIYGEKSVCTLNDNDLESLRKEIPSGDVILALCCSSGQMGIKKIVGSSSSINVLSIVEVVGTLYCHFEDKGEKQLIVKEKCVVVPFSCDKEINRSG